MQYTLRNVPPALDEALREKAEREGKSLNEVAVEALARALGLTDDVVKHRDLSDIGGTWIRDKKVDQAFDDQRQIDLDAWRLYRLSCLANFEPGSQSARVAEKTSAF